MYKKGRANYGKARFGSVIPALHFGGAVWAPASSALYYLGVDADCFGAKLFPSRSSKDNEDIFDELQNFFTSSVIFDEDLKMILTP
uniref:Uncharacterized protein n=1 Tax=Romanomermis culicivorax TaxID=13658 RepID=A0A915J146_ROMCU